MSQPPDKVALLYLTHTGNVLAAVMRHAPTAPPTVAQLVGTGLTVRHMPGDQGGAIVPAEELAVKEVDYDEALVSFPRDFRLLPDQSTVNLPDPGSEPDAVRMKVTVSATEIEFELDAAPAGGAPQNQNVWALVHATGTGSSTRDRVVRGTIPATDQGVAINLPGLTSGTYHVLWFAAGTWGALLEKQI